MSSPSDESQNNAEGLAFDLLLYGNEQILRGSDNGTLVAFAAIAFQQIRGKNEFHHNLACGILLFSVVMCAVIHFVIGNLYVGRARKLIRWGREPERRPLAQKVCLVMAWAAGLLQLASIVVGLLLLIPDQPPAFLENLFRSPLPEEQGQGSLWPVHPGERGV
jgi:hypothetical protein